MPWSVPMIHEPYLLWHLGIPLGKHGKFPGNRALGPPLDHGGFIAHRLKPCRHTLVPAAAKWLWVEHR